MVAGVVGGTLGITDWSVGTITRITASTTLVRGHHQTKVEVTDDEDDLDTVITGIGKDEQDGSINKNGPCEVNDDSKNTDDKRPPRPTLELILARLFYFCTLLVSMVDCFCFLL
jgi:hypothetical protein